MGQLHYCMKRRCLQSLLQTDFELLRFIRENKEAVELELSFFSSISQESRTILFKFVTKSALPDILSRLPTIQALFLNNSEEIQLIQSIGQEAYETLRKIVQTSPLRVKNIGFEELKSDLSLESPQKQAKVLAIANNSADLIARFEAEKTIHGSKMGFFMPSNSWFDALRQGNYRRTFVNGVKVVSGRWATPTLQVALSQAIQESATIGWPFSLLRQQVVVGIVEFISKPEYAREKLSVITNSSHFIIRAFAVVPILETFKHSIPGGPSFPFGYENRSHPSGNPALSMQRPIPSLGQRNPIDLRPWPPGPPENPAAAFERPSDPRHEVDPSTLPPELCAFYYQINENQRKSHPRLIWEMHQVLLLGKERVTLVLDGGSNIFLWYVTLQPTPDWSLSPSLSSDFAELSMRYAEPVAIQLRVTFNSFFPLTAPFFAIISPKIRSNAVTKDGLILQPPKWVQESTVVSHLEQAVKHVLQTPEARLEL